jgi:hypothetical protein
LLGLEFVGSAFCEPTFTALKNSSSMSKKENVRPSRTFSDLMTFLKTATFHRIATQIEASSAHCRWVMLYLSKNPNKLAREIAAEQFRPTEKETTTDAEPRETPEH